jgi:streptogramin lyase
MRYFRATVLSLCVSLLAGCSGAPFATQVKTNSIRGAAIQGKVHGGQTVITGANIYLYAANNTGYGNASISLLNSSGSNTQKDSNGNYYVTTGSDGSFGITGDYTCPSTTSQLYLYATGGNPGAGTNPVIGLLAALGTCQANSTLSPTLYIVINEVTTVAAAYALSGFATDATHVSSSGTPLALTGIANAFANAGNLASITTGNALTTTPAGNGTVPQVLINTLADLLAGCVNTTGVVSGPANPTVCYTLFNDTLSGGTTGSVPANTATSAIYLAHNPGANLDALGSLFQTLTADLPFQPAITSGSKVNDLTVSIAYADSSLDKPYSIAVDAGGNVWLGNYNGNSVTELSSLGVDLSGVDGFTGGGISNPWGIAIDGQGHVWIANFLVNTVTELSNTGTVLSPGTGYTGGYFSIGGAGVNIAIDGSGNVWIPNGNTGVAKLSSSGAVLGSFTGTGLDQPDSVAVDGSGNAWFANLSSAVSEFSSTGSALSGTNGYSSGSQPYGVAIDSSGNAWVGAVDGKITKLSPSGSVLDASSSGQNANVFGIDGAGSAWTWGGNGIIGISSSGAILSGPYNYQPPSLYGDQAAALDGSGDIWVANGGNNTVTEVIGAATPVITPIAAGLPATPTGNGSSNLGTRP